MIAASEWEGCQISMKCLHQAQYGKERLLQQTSLAISFTKLQGFLFTQISGHSPIKILKIRNISKLQGNFSIYWCWFYMPLVHLKWKCPGTKFSQQKSWDGVINWVQEPLRVVPFYDALRYYTFCKRPYNLVKVKTCILFIVQSSK